MPPLPSHVTPTLAAIHAARMRSRWTGRGSTFIAASQAGQECGRAIWYDFRWASPAEAMGARSIRRMATGDREEKRFLDELAQVEGVELWRIDPATGKQFRNEIDGLIAAKVDAVALGLPEAPKSPHNIECKATNAKNFRAVKAKGVRKAKPDHWLQVQLNMIAMGVKRALYWVVNTDDDDEYIERIKPDAEATSAAVARLTGIALAARPPGKIRDDTAKPPCLWCRHKGVCHEGALARVNCRTCVSATPGRDGVWRCDLWERDLTPAEQEYGCAKHVFIPELVPGEQIDADAEARTVTYRMADGRVWVDGQEGKPAGAEVVVLEAIR